MAFLPMVPRCGLRTRLLPYSRPSIQSVLRRTVMGSSRAGRSISENGELGSAPQPQSSQSPKQAENVREVEIDVSTHPVFKRLPRFMHKYAINFINTPVSHVTSFMILHEFTAIAPLFGFWWMFHYMDFMPHHLPEWLTANGVDFIKVLAERNGWDFSTEEGAKWLVEGAAAYGIVKLLLPVRAGLSLVLMPWFAKTFVIPVTKLFRVFIPKKNIRKKTKEEPVWEQDLSQGIKRKEIDSKADDGKPKL